MSKYRQLKPKQLIEPQESKLSDRPLVIIGRQSTTRQIEENRESLKLQIEDQRQRFVSQGWSQDIITIRMAGDGLKGVSGTLRIDQRSELQDTIADIKNGSCKAVGCYSISRLFRDRFGVEVTTFMKICAEYDCLVILPDKVYDFRTENDVTMFTIYARFAAIENEQRKKLLRDAKHNKALRGEYDGRNTIPGYIVDRSKLTDKGKVIAGKWLTFEPHAEVVRWLYARFRELGGQFNLLAAEVARMKIVFPPFEEWVSQLDINRFRLCEVCAVHGEVFHTIKRKTGTIQGNHCGFKGEQCKLLGYHISRTSLMHLLSAVEYRGFWHTRGEILTDEHGKRIVNHDPIVDADDWQYAFDRLSFQTLDGLENTKRTQGQSWTPVTSQDKSGALRGLLTSPLGSVNCSGGYYRVTEHRPNHSQNSDTLVVDREMLDAIFLERLSNRMLEVDQNKFFYYQLKQLKEQHKRALVSVAEQHENYHQERLNIQAYIAANGANIDVPTLQSYNARLLEITTILFDLQDKQTEAAEEEDKIKKLRDRLRRMKTLLGVDGANEYSRTFMKLCTDAIILSEYSSRFLTLTIAWAAPFKRVDRCYIWRPKAARQEWSTEEEDALIPCYAYSDRLDILKQFPTRTWYSIAERAKKLGLFREIDRNVSGLQNKGLSYNDWKIISEHGWVIPDKPVKTADEKESVFFWLYDIVDDTLEIPVKPS